MSTTTTATTTTPTTTTPTTTTRKGLATAAGAALLATALAACSGTAADAGVPGTDNDTAAAPGDASADDSPSSERRGEDAAQERGDTPTRADGTTSGGNPFSRLGVHASSWHPAMEAADDLRDDRPEDAALLDRLAAVPTARWLGEWSGDVQVAADQHVSEAAEAGALPVLVAYNIPVRDCGQYSSGGAGAADDYAAWIQGIAAGIDERPAVVVLEPDAVALTDCLDEQQQEDRETMLSDAIATLEANDGTDVYLDAGHSAWVAADEMAERLLRSGVERARGIALNVSNDQPTEDLVAYAAELHEATGAHAVLDTSRNGNGSTGEWCNGDGRALGAAPTADTGEAFVDAWLWIKVPGESDGTCNGGPAAGEFFTTQALEMARAAGW